MRLGIVRLLKPAGLALSLALMPSAALAVSMSSGDGDGYGYVQTHTNHSFYATGSLRAYTDFPVYSQGQLVYDGNTDDNCGRWTENVTSRTQKFVSGICGVDIRIGSSADAARFRVCKPIRLLPDSCGAWSAKDW